MFVLLGACLFIGNVISGLSSDRNEFSRTISIRTCFEVPKERTAPGNYELQPENITEEKTVTVKCTKKYPLIGDVMEITYSFPVLPNISHYCPDFNTKNGKCCTQSYNDDVQYFSKSIKPKHDCLGSNGSCNITVYQYAFNLTDYPPGKGNTSMWIARYADIRYSCTKEPMKAVDCVTPKNPQKGSVIVNRTTYQEIARYTCDSGHDLIGEKFSVCTADKTWSDAAPTCKERPSDNVVTVVVVVVVVVLLLVACFIAIAVLCYRKSKKVPLSTQESESDAVNLHQSPTEVPSRINIAEPKAKKEARCLLVLSDAVVEDETLLC